MISSLTAETFQLTLHFGWGILPQRFLKCFLGTKHVFSVALFQNFRQDEKPTHPQSFLVCSPRLLSPRRIISGRCALGARRGVRVTRAEQERPERVWLRPPKDAVLLLCSSLASGGFILKLVGGKAALQ